MGVGHASGRMKQPRRRAVQCRPPHIRSLDYRTPDRRARKRGTHPVIRVLAGVLAAPAAVVAVNTLIDAVVHADGRYFAIGCISAGIAYILIRAAATSGLVGSADSPGPPSG
jgi:hypothetical protein